MLIRHEYRNCLIQIEYDTSLERPEDVTVEEKLYADQIDETKNIASNDNEGSVACFNPRNIPKV